MRALRDRKGDHTINAERGQKQRDHSEGTEEEQREALAGERFVSYLIQRLWFGQGYLRIDRMDGRRDAGLHRSRVLRRADTDGRLRPRDLPEGNQHLLQTFLLVCRMHVLIYA